MGRLSDTSVIKGIIEELGDLGSRVVRLAHQRKKVEDDSGIIAEAEVIGREGQALISKHSQYRDDPNLQKANLYFLLAYHNLDRYYMPHKAA